MEELYVKNRREWRKWLTQNAQSAKEMWLLYYKKRSRKPRIPYGDAVEEALCFGWIDSTLRKIDEDRFAQRFTPRKPRSAWTKLNIDRAERLLAEGKMTAAGLTAFNSATRRTVAKQPAELPPDLGKQFRAQAAAWENFQKFPPYYRRMTSGWVGSAKKDDTRQSRLQKLIDYSARNERIKFM